jgi:hypothetical protein
VEATVGRIAESRKKQTKMKIQIPF